METRMVAIWFPHLVTDWIVRRKPQLKEVAFALAVTERGRRVVKAVNPIALAKGVRADMVVADCKAIFPDLMVEEYDPEKPVKLLTAVAEWCIRYTPFVSLDLPDTLLLNASGCTHLWGGEDAYLQDIHQRFEVMGYSVRTAMADTIGTAWAVCKFGKNKSVIKSGKELEAISSLPPEALRLESTVLERLDKLGLKTIDSFIKMPSAALRRRFGQHLITRAGQAIGGIIELTESIIPLLPYQERLPSLEPIRDAPGIEIALRELLETLCGRLQKECKGVRQCEFRCHRLDGKLEKIAIGTSKPTRNTLHLFKLFENKISQIEPDLGIELFILEATVVEELQSTQDTMWTISGGSEAAIAELLDRIASRTGEAAIHRYLPAEHYWPERSFKDAKTLNEKPATEWRTDLPRPLHMLSVPERIEVSVRLPDYPPLLFRYKGVLHNVKKADGPERIEQEWWMDQGLYRDYYCVEDEQGARYWLFRSGDYNSENPQWFLHGFFA